MARERGNADFRGIRRGHEGFLGKILPALDLMGCEVLRKTPWGGEGCDLVVIFPSERIYHIEAETAAEIRRGGKEWRRKIRRYARRGIRRLKGRPAGRRGCVIFITEDGCGERIPRHPGSIALELSELVEGGAKKVEEERARMRRAEALRETLGGRRDSDFCLRAQTAVELLREAGGLSVPEMLRLLGQYTGWPEMRPGYLRVRRVLQELEGRGMLRSRKSSQRREWYLVGGEEEAPKRSQTKEEGGNRAEPGKVARETGADRAPEQKAKTSKPSPRFSSTLPSRAPFQFDPFHMPPMASDKLLTAPPPKKSKK